MIASTLWRHQESPCTDDRGDTLLTPCDIDFDEVGDMLPESENHKQSRLARQRRILHQFPDAAVLSRQLRYEDDKENHSSAAADACCSRKTARKRRIRDRGAIRRFLIDNLARIASRRLLVTRNALICPWIQLHVDCPHSRITDIEQMVPGLASADRIRQFILGHLGTLYSCGMPNRLLSLVFSEHKNCTVLSIQRHFRVMAD